MPLKVNLGITKKIGLPHYGSLGTSCHLEVELDGGLIHDAPSLQTRVRQLYAACSQAVHDELARQQSSAQVAASGAAPAEANGASHSANGSSSAPPMQRASQRQLDYLLQLARQVRGLGWTRLEGLVRQQFQRPLSELHAEEASGLIDTLKAVKEGRLELETLFDGVQA